MRAVLAGLFAVIATTTAVQADELRDLVNEADMAYRGTTSAAVLTMEVTTSQLERSYDIVVWADSAAKLDRTLVKILGPALWRGFGTLKVGNKLTLYNPKTNHVTAVSSSMLGDSWMGSHFTNDDLVKETRLSEDFSLTLVDQRELDGATHYRVKMTPKPHAPVAWGAVVYEVARIGSEVVPVSARYYRKAKDKQPERTIKFADRKRMGGRLVPATMTITLADKPGEFTRITYKKLKFGVKIPKSKFSERALRN